jgi:hypothetical protein
MLSHQNSWIAESATDMLYLTSAEGRICRYRWRNGQLEYQAGPYAFWVVLCAEQTMQHLSLGTVVGKWLRDRLKG